MPKLSCISLFFILTLSGSGIAQLKVDTEIRPRLEYRHGFGTLFPVNEEPSAFVSQRSRLNFGFTREYLKLYVSVQDIRVWGDVPQLNRADRNGLGVHQAWGELYLSPVMALKLGRQVLNYDDQRIFGGVDWAQQARSHDLALLSYSKDLCSIHLGAAFNQEEESNTGNLLKIVNTYKSLQYFWFHREWKPFSASLLFLNNGMQYIDDINADNNETRFSQTIGTHLELNGPHIGWYSNLYYQFGKDQANNDLNAYLLALEAHYKINDRLSVVTGAEIISGNKGGTPSGGQNRAFSPFYGTNHKFNGLMDYFYVGNHANNVGLLDVYLGSGIVLGNKTSMNGRLHYLSAANDIKNSENKHLGVEADLVLNYNFREDINVKAGYSHLFAFEGMNVLKNNFDESSNYWGWVMVTVNPVLLQSTL